MPCRARTLHFEWEALGDALRHLSRIRAIIPHYHGPAFRELEQDLEAWAARPDAPQLHDLGEGRVVAAAPESLTVLLVRARDLGVGR